MSDEADKSIFGTNPPSSTSELRHKNPRIPLRESVDRGVMSRMRACVSVLLRSAAGYRRCSEVLFGSHRSCV